MVMLSNVPEFAISSNLVNPLIMSCRSHQSCLNWLQKQKSRDRIPYIWKQIEGWFNSAWCHLTSFVFIIIFILFMQWWKKKKLRDPGSALKLTVQSTMISRQWNGCFQPQNLLYLLACLFYLNGCFDFIATWASILENSSHCPSPVSQWGAVVLKGRLKACNECCVC